MPLPNPKSHRITLADAVAHAKRFREGGATQLGGLFLRKDIDDLLAQKGCAGLRFYHGRTADGGPALVLVGVDADG